MNVRTSIKHCYHLYVSQSWQFNHAYTKLNSLLDSRRDFTYTNYFVAEQDIDFSYTERQLYESIRAKMKHCDVILVMCGVYSQYSNWLNKEIILGKNELNKPIIAIQPFESTRISTIVKQHADRVIDWDRDAIIRSIQEFA